MSRRCNQLQQLRRGRAYAFVSPGRQFRDLEKTTRPFADLRYVCKSCSLNTVLRAAITVSDHVIVKVFPFGQTQRVLFYNPVPHILILAEFLRQTAGVRHMSLAGIVGTQHKIHPLFLIRNMMPVVFQSVDVFRFCFDVL